MNLIRSYFFLCPMARRGHFRCHVANFAYNQWPYLNVLCNDIISIFFICIAYVYVFIYLWSRSAMLISRLKNTVG
jgi:hypothetical protein